MAKLGIKAKLFVNTTYGGGPTWKEINAVGDGTLDVEWDKGNASSRASRVKKMVKTMLGLSIKAKLKVGNDDTNGYVTLWAASLDDTVLDVMVLNGPPSEVGTRGWRFDAQVFSGNEDQGMTNAIYDDFTVEPTDSGAVVSSVVYNAPNTPTFTTVG